MGAKSRPASPCALLAWRGAVQGVIGDKREREDRHISGLHAGARESLGSSWLPHSFSHLLHSSAWNPRQSQPVLRRRRPTSSLLRPRVPTPSSVACQLVRRPTWPQRCRCCCRRPSRSALAAAAARRRWCSTRPPRSSSSKTSNSSSSKARPPPAAPQVRCWAEREADARLPGLHLPPLSFPLPACLLLLCRAPGAPPSAQEEEEGGQGAQRQQPQPQQP